MATSDFHVWPGLRTTILHSLPSLKHPVQHFTAYLDLMEFRKSRIWQACIWIYQCVAFAVNIPRGKSCTSFLSIACYLLVLSIIVFSWLFAELFFPFWCLNCHTFVNDSSFWLAHLSTYHHPWKHSCFLVTTECTWSLLLFLLQYVDLLILQGSLVLFSGESFRDKILAIGMHIRLF